MTLSLTGQKSLDQFLEACGAFAEFRLHIVHAELPAAACKTFAGPFALIGRAARADLTLNHDQVSRRHAYLQVIDGRVLCIDLHSRTGTHWRNGPRRCGWLDAEEHVGIGPFTLQVGGDDEFDAPAPMGNPLVARPEANDDLPRASLEFLNGVTAQRQWRLAPVLTLVGQAPPCQVRLKGDSVSPFHCSLVRTRAGVWVIDLLGRGGVFVNRRRLRWALLNDGDRLRIGRFETRVRYDESPVVPMNHWYKSQHNGRDWPNAPAPHETSLVPATTAPFAPVSPLQRASEPLVWHLVDQFTAMQQHMFDQFQQATLMMVQMFGALHKEQFSLIQKELERLHELSDELRTVQRELRERQLAPAATQEGRSQPMLEQEPLEPAPAAAAEPAVFAQAAAQSALPASSVPSGQSEAEVHKWLSERFTAIEKERQSSWQRILNFMKVKRKDESVP